MLSFVSVGPPVPGHEVRIVDGEGRDVPGARRGRAVVSRPFDDAADISATRKRRTRFSGGPREAGWLDSGDRAYRADEEIFITGRVKDIILKAGRNIYPHEVEEIAARVDGRAQRMRGGVGRADAAAGTERLIVVAETREREAAARERIAAAIARKCCAAIGVPPDAVEMLPPHSIPKTSSGKLRRDETRQSLPGRHARRRRAAAVGAGDALSAASARAHRRPLGAARRSKGCTAYTRWPLFAVVAAAAGSR